MAKNLKAVLEEFSRWSWNLLQAAHTLEASIGEETLTDLLSIEIIRKQIPMRIVQTIKPKEAWTGTDIEAWLGNDTTGWQLFAIQAKNLDQSDNYPQFNETQLNTLERYAHQRNAVPSYLLYNHTNDAQKKHGSCKRPLKIKQLGCTITPSRIIRSTMAQGHGFDSIHKDSCTIPLRCLAECSEFCTPDVQGRTLLEPLASRRLLRENLPEFLTHDELYITPMEFRRNFSYAGELGDIEDAGLPRYVCVFDTTEEEELG